uniref:Zinc finger protein 19 n=1 Tax=Homo sapiens TaxID=9606 RepID=H3BR98_HUMAN
MAAMPLKAQYQDFPSSPYLSPLPHTLARSQRIGSGAAGTCCFRRW